MNSFCNSIFNKPVPKAKAPEPEAAAPPPPSKEGEQAPSTGEQTPADTEMPDLQPEAEAAPAENMDID